VTFADGWICRSCWKPNRARDQRCYRCGTARDADDRTVAARRTELAEEQVRGDGVPVFVSTVPALVFRVYSWFGFLATALVGLVGILAVLAGGRSGDLVAITIIFVAFLAYSLVLRWVSGEMRAANMWAFLIGFVISALGVFGTILALDRLPDGIGNPVWMRYITVAVFSVAGTLAFVGFVLRIARRG
jgi:hypothetical protein